MKNRLGENMIVNAMDKKLFIFIALIFTILSSEIILSQNSAEKEAIISVNRIWDRAQHSAFTSLIRFNDKFYICFREGSGHVPGINGTIRIISSEDGQNWKSFSHLDAEGIDLRDPQLSITPDKRIMLNMGGSVYSGTNRISMHPLVSFSNKNGELFSSPSEISVDPKIKTKHDWLWKATWHKEMSYATIYQVAEGGTILQLVQSKDGINYKHLNTFDLAGSPNEAALRFDSDNNMIAIIRRGAGNSFGYIGISRPPYTDWNLRELDARLGGPNIILLPNGKILCGTREYPPDFEQKMILSLVNTDGYFKKLITLPSGGDCSYPGLVVHENLLYVSYYSTHEEKTSIYFAKIRLDKLENWTEKEITPDPYIKYDKEGIIELACSLPNAIIKYTLDGSIPTFSSGFRYEKPFKVDRTSLLRALAFKSDFLESNVVSASVGEDVFQEAVKSEHEFAPGLNYDYYEGIFSEIYDFQDIKPSFSGVTPNPSILKSTKKENFGYEFYGYINIPEDGFYTFYLTSNDGSLLELNETVLINNDGLHGKREIESSISLRKGKHKISVKYFQTGGGSFLRLQWKCKNFEKEEVPAEVLFH